MWCASGSGLLLSDEIRDFNANDGSPQWRDPADTSYPRLVTVRMDERGTAIARAARSRSMKARF
jgi:hypothetical protein